MTPPRRKRSVQLNFRVSEEELAAIEGKMEQLGILNREAYLRKMALDGYAVRLDLPELKELLSLLRRHGSTLPGGFTRRTWRILSRDRANFGRPLARY